MRDFQKAVIYKASCKDGRTKKIYIGSTTDMIYRIYKHRYCCNTPYYCKYNMPLYKHIRENGGFDNFEFSVIYEFENCENDEQLRKKETDFINIYKDICINKATPYKEKK